MDGCLHVFVDPESFQFYRSFRSKDICTIVQVSLGMNEYVSCGVKCSSIHRPLASSKHFLSSMKFILLTASL